MYNNDLTETFVYRQWVYIFATFSLSDFYSIYVDLDFPIIPTSQLQDIARNFIISDGLLKKDTIPFSGSQNYLELVSAQKTYEEKKSELIKTALNLTENLHDGQLILEWGYKTHRFYNHETIASLTAWIHVLTRWTLITILTEEQPDNIRYLVESLSKKYNIE